MLKVLVFDLALCSLNWWRLSSPRALVPHIVSCMLWTLAKSWTELLFMFCFLGRLWICGGLCVWLPPLSSRKQQEDHSPRSHKNVLVYRSRPIFSGPFGSSRRWSWARDYKRQSHNEVSFKCLRKALSADLLTTGDKFMNLLISTDIYSTSEHVGVEVGSGGRCPALGM